MSKPCPCYGPCLAGDDRCPLIAPDPVAALLRHERDSLATQLDDAKQAIVTFRATMEQMRRERDEARAEAERFHEAMIEARRGVGPDSERFAAMEQHRDMVIGEMDATWKALGEIGRGRGVTLSERAAKVVAVRDALHAKLARVRERLDILSRAPSLGAQTVAADVLRIIDEKEGGQ